MVKTLRIAGVAAVAFAGVVLASVLGRVSLIHLEGPGDEKMEKILVSAGAVDRFRELHADGDQANQDTTPPLVKQAELFKDIIDPKVPTPVATAEKTAVTPRAIAPRKPESTSQTLTLLGTAVSPSNPSSSFAYIRFQDSTCQWVACGSEVGHLVIKEVKEDSIICWDGRRDSELAIEVVPDRASLLEDNGEAPASATVETPQPVEVKIVEPPSDRPPRLPNRLAPPMTSAAPRLTAGEQKSLDDLASKLKNLPGGPGDGSVVDANRTAAIEKLMSEFKSSRVGPEEARHLENLGGDSSTEKQRAREEQRREFIRRLNSGRSVKD